MSIELSIFNVFCKDREKHLLYNAQVQSLENLEKELKLLFGLLSAYYTEYSDVDSVTPDILVDYFKLKYPRSKEEEIVIDLIWSASEKEINEDIIDQFFDQLNEKYVATSVIERLMPVMEGNRFGVLHTIRDTIDDYVESMTHKPTELEVPTPCKKTVHELIKEQVQEKGLPWRLPNITNVVGGIRDCSLGLIYAFVDSGKTSFSLDNVANWSNFLKEGENICYAGNEEDKDRLMLRLVQAYIKQPWPWLEHNIAEAEALAEEHSGFYKVNIFDDIVSGEQIKYILKTYRPKILVIDQATDVNIKTMRKSDGVEYLKQLFKWYRRLANEYKCGIIGVSQGVGIAENTKWLKLSDIYGSRVAIQGALDYAIGIGRKVDDATLENKRYINIPKNKLNGGEGGRVTVSFFKSICQWKET